MKLIILFALFATVVAAPTTTPGAKTYPPQPYSFSYSVFDKPTFNEYSHSESSDGNVVTGSYRVYLPDGRIQTVTYRADSNGYVADVKYEYSTKPGWIPSAIGFRFRQRF